MPSAARLQLFGVPTLEHAGSAWALPFERRSQLLVFLALKRGWVGRAEVAALLWPEQGTRLGFSNLRKTLFRLPQLPWGQPVHAQGGALRFDGDSDVVDFEALIAGQRWAEALALRRGELLSGFDDDANEAWTGWLAFERERQRVAWRGAALAWLATDVPGPAAVALTAQLIEADPLDEAALRQHLGWLVRTGQLSEARQAHGRFVQRLASELGLEPSPHLLALRDSLADAFDNGAPTAALPALVVSAPATDPTFIGRSAELRQIASLLEQDDCRLLCLLGPGGVGKTRLARRALQELAPGFAQGVAFVSLEDVNDTNALAEKLVREVAGPGAQASSSVDPLSAAITSLQGRQLLLALDNFEGLAAQAACLQRLLDACPGVKLLVTSRVRLAVTGEWTLAVEGLPSPDAEDLDRFEAFDAVRLFVRSARRVKPDWQPANDAAAIVDICRQVEGLPLALELAAAWLRLLPCQAIAAELRAGSALLQAQDAAHPPRHASIEQVFDQSWRQLGAVERDALARLSVFRGGFTAPAARTVAGASLPVLAALADKSLLAGDGPRMRLHPLVQQWAALRLADTGARTDTDAAHAAYFQRWLAQWGVGAEAGERSALQAIDAEFENCAQAWRFAAAHGQADALAQSAPTLLNYFEHRARFEEGLALFRLAIGSALAQGHSRLRALLLSQASLLELRLARYGLAQQTAAEALATKQGGSDPATRFQAVSVLAGCAMLTGRLGEARRLDKRALALARSSAVPRRIAATLENLALCEKRLGHYDAALSLSLEALAQHRHNHDSARLALCLSNLGSLTMLMHDEAAAEAYLQEARRLCEAHGLVSTHAFVLANLTELAMKAQDAGAAREHAERALAVAEQTGMRSLSAWLKVQLARLAARRGALDLARECLATGATLALTLEAPYLKAAVLQGLAELWEVQGQPEQARRVLAFGVAQTELSAPDRDELRIEWARRTSPEQADEPWPGIGLNDLLQRVATERLQAHAPLLALLRSRA